MRYVPELDGLRAIAVTAVVLFHSAPFGPFSGGFVGVDLFFVLSAFLITGILERGQPLGEFYGRRALRLLPPLFLMLAVYVVIAPAIWPDARPTDALLTYVSDFTYPPRPRLLQHTWSLAIEEQFYLIWPFALPLIRRPPWLVGIYVLLTVWRLAFVGDFHDYYYRFDTHSTGLILGAWLYFAKPQFKNLHAGIAAATLGIILLLGDIRSAWLWITPAELAAAILIGWSLNGSATLSWRPLRKIGKLSYGIYLWHFPVAYGLRFHLGFVSIAVITFAVSTGMAALSYVTIEAWARRFKDRTRALTSA